MILAVAALATIAAAVWSLHAALGGSDPGGKSGARPTVELDLAVVEYPGSAAERIARRLAKRVDTLSHQSMSVTIASWPTRFRPTTPTRRVGADALRAVRSDDVQIGLIPSHAFEAHGVTSLRALQAPFVLTTWRLAARATTGAVADRLTSGLDAISLTPLGLIPEGLERPFGFLKPLLTPADFRGVAIKADSSRATHELLRALGARPVEPNSGSTHTALYSGFADDADSLPSATDDFPRDSYTATGLVLFPRVDVVVVSSGALGRLTSGERSILRRAVADVRNETIAAADRAEGRAFCADGGTIVTAPASAVHALRAKTAALLDAFRRDPAGRMLVAAARSAKSQPAAVACAPVAVAPAPSDTYHVTHDERVALVPPIGTFRRVISHAQLRRAAADEADARRNAGVTTLTFYGEALWPRFVVEWPGGTRPLCRGRVAFEPGRIVLQWNPNTPCSGHVAFSWTRTGRGDLTLASFDSQTAPAWLKRTYAGTWKRVDCAPECGDRDKLTAGETRLVLLRQLRGKLGTLRIGCHRIRNSAWDYECFSFGRNGDDVGRRWGVDVDAHGITRTNLK
jgi:TRAP-type C4-dicarboxylate transport system substrate-binding protein